MHSSLLLLGASLGLASARVRPKMYGVPKVDAGIDDMPDMFAGDIMATADNITGTDATNTTAPGMPTATAPEPCAVISSAVAAMPRGARKVVPAELGMRCLETVPLDKDGNIKLIDDLKLYLGWQSNLAYLKNPPPTYTEDPVDLMGEMESMQTQLASGGYRNEYEFQSDLSTLFNRAYDNHLGWQPDILAGVMQFQRPAGTELVSVSADGTSLPEIYSYRDLMLAKNNTSFKPSPIRTINGQGVEEYLMTVAPQADFHDANTRWNALFPSQSLIASGETYLGSFRTGKYQGPNTTMSFANGTTNSVMNLAVVLANFTGVNSGPAFFKKFCTGPSDDATTSTMTTSTASSTPTAQPSHTGYPKAVILNPNLSVGGYYLEGSGYEDVAVLSIPSYESPDVQRFQNTMRDFIRMSVKAGKTKMIFDLRGNGGGNAILGYDSFKQVFPMKEQDPYGGTRYRDNPALKIMGQVTSDFNNGNTYVQKNASAFDENFMGNSMDDVVSFIAGINYQHQLDTNNQKIKSWDQMYGPQKLNGDQFTTTLRYNFSDEVSYTYPGFSVIGYLNNTNETMTPQPFKPGNMVMLNDGMCSSTCTIFAELIKNQGGVRTIAVGGQPKSGPMQGIGGTKGAQNLEWGDVQTRAQVVYFLGSPDQQRQWNQTDLGKTAFPPTLFTRSAYSDDGTAIGGINLRDNLRRDDTSGTPLEFIYEAADCRMFYTAPMINDVTMVWKGVVDRMFTSGNSTAGAGMGVKGCVPGSTGAPTSVSGGGQKKGGEKFTDDALMTTANAATRVSLGWLAGVVVLVYALVL
ncbi:hypothetical protein K504DRAFT_390754 [Pleomassaria siparia CBS 279.74]|uniref:Uncharacterized protein n=1 Tax=Pleomassaria siparia CBS 279.74 TaxID=1314801 RepID=A0A6G1JV75_9PLEO|nr:hypothetical protein K504DRAFT_390754 [Pleomassaria siparia CBS 279.74]